MTDLGLASRITADEFCAAVQGARAAANRLCARTYDLYGASWQVAAMLLSDEDRQRLHNPHALWRLMIAVETTASLREDLVLVDDMLMRESGALEALFTSEPGRQAPLADPECKTRLEIDLQDGEIVSTKGKIRRVFFLVLQRVALQIGERVIVL